MAKYFEYKGYKVAQGKDGRYRASNPELNRYVSFPRLLMEEKLGRKLLPNEDVHHIDGDVTNNALENLEVIDHVEHCRQHKPKRPNTEFTCVWCGNKFIANNIRQSSRIREDKRGKHGPFCSRQCSGKYGAYVQNGYIEKGTK